ncbi:MAG: zinc ribbon domain-containing protein [Abitibacteriaceae bacterium]|nr:zinc ribbon domain-containing protein [Abditibacteriaceae bacterium]MBV9867643.1 zinc ribbon domain-containing protein [Abditibacteriaceae bacterium]
MQADPQETSHQGSAPAGSTQTSETAFSAFAPLPLRPRGVLEILDIAIKVYKQYFWVLLSWSVLVVSASLLATVIGMVIPFGGSLPSILLKPLITGVVACCIAAAVRGQRVEFKQCWQFTKPRFWPMVGLSVLALIVTMFALMGFFAICGLIFGLGFLIFRSAADGLQLTLIIIAGFIGLAVGTVIATVLFTWQGLVPVVVSMEQDKMNTAALSRAYELLRGQWVRVCTLMTLLGLGMLALSAIFMAVGALLIGLPQIEALLNGQAVNTTVWETIVGIGLSYSVIWIIWNPMLYIIMNLLYLDMRVLKEALDLEWAAHVTAPKWDTPAPGAPPPDAAYNSGFATPSYSSNPLSTYSNVNSVEVAPVNMAIPSKIFSETATPDIATPNILAPLPNDDIATIPTGFISPTTETQLTADAMPHPADVPLPETQDIPTAQNEAITCPQCGTVAPAAQDFCLHCGARLHPTNSTPAPRW